MGKVWVCSQWDGFMGTVWGLFTDKTTSKQRKATETKKSVNR